MKNALALSLSSLALLLGACSPDTATLTSERPIPPPQEAPVYAPIAAQEFKWVTEDGGQSQLDFNPQVDILFVTDNSDSMKAAQENLANNIDRFTFGIAKNKMIDYHIGVISTWDSSDRFSKSKKDAFGIGELRFVKNSKGVPTTERFITKAETSKAALAASINIGVAPLAEGGPENEEFFSPLMAALEKTGRGAANEGFFRENAQLVVIFMTDADDSTERISAEQMSSALKAFKGNRDEKLSVYGVLVSKKTPDQYKDYALRIHPNYHPECFDFKGKVSKNNGKCTEGFGPVKIEELIATANEDKKNPTNNPEEIKKHFIMDIISPKFGDELAKLGDAITVKTLEKEISLEQRPRELKGVVSVRVRYGNQEILQDGGKNWLYDGASNSIKLSGNVKYEYVEGARFSVDLIPVNIK